MKPKSISNQRQLLLVGFISFLLLAVVGCGGARKGISIDSDPQGADIIADGKNIGKTPKQISQDDVFPPHWHGTSYMVKGNLEIQKEGCEGYSMEVNDLVLSKDIKANLKCRQIAMQPVNQPASVSHQPVTTEAAPAAPVQKAPSAAAKTSTAADEIEKRLAKLKSLRDKGVISAEEYADQRKRILDSL